MKMPGLRIHWEHVLTVSIVICGMAVSAAWALTVPIFQNPDEPAHYDYVVGLRIAGRPILARNGRASNVKDNAVIPYLADIASTNRIAFHPQERVGPEEGTRAWIERVDAEAPPPDRDYLAPGHPVPMLSNDYPIGYYGLTALFTGVVGLALHGVVESFYAARLFSSLLFGATLVLTAVLFRDLRVDRATRLLLLSGIALFPMCSFVTASVQPDVLIGLILTASTVAFVRYQRKPTFGNVSLAASLIAAGMLTKPVYTAPAITTFLGLIIANRARRCIGVRDVVHHASVVLVPAMVAFVVDRVIAYQPPGLAAVSEPVAVNTDEPRAALALGLSHFVSYVVTTAGNQIWNDFFAGLGAASYWGDFGWLDTPLRVGDLGTDIWVTSAQMAYRDLVAILGCASFLYVVWRCIVALRRNETPRAIGIIFNDPALALFLWYDAAIITVGLVMPNIGYQGRYWYPVIALSVLVSSRYAARIVPLPAYRLTLQRFLALWLCVWSLTMSGVAANDIRKRYYAVIEHPASGLSLARSAYAYADLPRRWTVHECRA